MGIEALRSTLRRRAEVGKIGQHCTFASLDLSR
jgi:hypothetical protein